MRSIGIDPGLSGYIAAVDGEQVLETVATPTVKIGKTKRDYDMVGMRDVLVRLDGDVVVLEKQQAMPGQGVTSMFRTGWGFGLWYGLIVGVGMRIVVPHPRTWQKVLHRDIPGDDTKGRSILACGRLYPHKSLFRTPRCKKPDHNMADAILLAHWGVINRTA